VNDDDLAIHGILTRILKKWEAMTEVQRGDLKKTIVPSPGRKMGGFEDEKQNMELSGIPKTVIIRPLNSDGSRGTETPGSSEVSKEDETVITGPKGSDAGRDPGKKHFKNEPIPETIILSPGGAAAKQGDAVPRREPAGGNESGRTLSVFEKTEKTDIPKKPLRKAAAQEFLTETVILKPEKQRKKKDGNEH